MKVMLTERTMRVVPCPWHGTHVTVRVCRTCDHFKGLTYEGSEDDPGEIAFVDCEQAGVTP